MSKAPARTAAVYRLEDHLEDCEQRYQHVITRLNSVDARLERMEDMLIEIRNKMGGSRPISTHKLLPR